MSCKCVRIQKQKRKQNAAVVRAQSCARSSVVVSKETNTRNGVCDKRLVPEAPAGFQQKEAEVQCVHMSVRSIFTCIRMDDKSCTDSRSTPHSFCFPAWAPADTLLCVPHIPAPFPCPSIPFSCSHNPHVN